MAALNSGGYVVTWVSLNQDGGGQGIFAQRYDFLGRPDGDEFQVNTTTVGDQTQPRIAAFNLGFVVTWTSYNGTNSEVMCQRFDADGERIGKEFPVNTEKTNYQAVPVVTQLANGGFAVAWTSTQQDGSLGGVYAQRFKPNGARAGQEFRVNVVTANHQEFPTIAGLTNGGFVIGWQSWMQDTSGVGVFARIYSMTGTPAATEFPVNTFTTGDQGLPDVTGLNNGGFFFAWTSFGQDGDNLGIFGQRFTP